MSLLHSLLFLTSVVSADPVTQIDQRHISPICSTATPGDSIERVSLPNTHVVLEKNNKGVPVYRSNSPYLAQHVLDVLSLGIQNVVVYKNFYDQKDKDLLYSLYEDSGFDTKNLFHIPMPWKRDGKKPFNFRSACEMSVKAMDLLENSPTPALFHCTVGEDRTGMLAGLLQVKNGMSVMNAFRDEMCGRGYEAGNPRKSESPAVVEAVREVLTPLYLKMATVITTNGEISKSDCADLPEVYVDDLRAEELVCESVRDEFLCPVDIVTPQPESLFQLAPSTPNDVLPFEY